jgi:hypothetical protein
MARDPRVTVRLEAKDNLSPAVEQAAGRSQGAFARFGNFLRNRFVFTLGDVRNAVTSLGNAIQDAANLENATESVRRGLAAQGESFDEFIAKLREVSDAQVSTQALISTSAKALVADLQAADIASLLEVARAAAIATGTDVESAFQRITDAVVKSETELLDELGIVVRLDEALKEMGTSADGAAVALDKDARVAATLNAVLDQGADLIDRYGTAQSEVSRRTNQARAALINFNTQLDRTAPIAAAVAGVIGQGLAQAFVLAGIAITATAEAFARFTQLVSQANLSGPITSLSNLRKALTSTSADLFIAQNNLATFVVEGTKGLIGLEDAAVQTGAALLKLGDQTTRTNRPIRELKDVVEEVDDAFDEVIPGVISFGNAQGAAAVQATQLAEALARQATTFRTNPELFRGDFARQAAERRARLSGSSIGQPLFGFQDPLLSGGGPSGGVFTRVTRPVARPDGGVEFA